MCHVLIIEDEFLLALELQLLLEAHGATTFAFAATEREAIAAARAQKPDFITSDVQLLEGLGPHAVQVIHQEIGPVPVIFITATPGACQAYAHLGQILPKPFSHREIVSAFQKIVPQAS